MTTNNQFVDSDSKNVVFPQSVLINSFFQNAPKKFTKELT